MKYSILISILLAVSSLAITGDFNWLSFGGSAGEPYSVSLVESEVDHMLLEVTVPGFSLDRVSVGGVFWDSIKLPGNNYQGSVGAPEVPSIVQMFALPLGSNVIVSIENIEYTTYTDINLLPTQPAEIDITHNSFQFCQDQIIYSSDHYFPDNWAEAKILGFWGGIRVGRLLVSPFRYNPVTKELLVARSITIKILFEEVTEVFAYPSTEAVRNSASRLLVNYDLVESAASAFTDTEAPEYIFVTTNNNLDEVLPLIKFYQSIGYESSVEVFSSPAEPFEIKNAIYDSYDTGTTRFALIAGDFEDLPSYDYGPFVGDFWYACLTGSDLLPEIAVGRLTGSPSQISNQVEKIISDYYQYDFPQNSSSVPIPSTGVLLAHEQDYPESYTECCNQIAAADYSANMNWTKIYPPEGGNNSMVEEAFNSGIGSVGYRGHAYVLNWTWGPKWSKTNINSLTNSFKPPVWSIACYTGQYQSTAESLAESFVWSSYGASGVLAATSASYTEPNHSFMKQLYLNLYLNENYNIGEAINEAAAWIVSNHGSIGEDNAKMFIWFGDPAMELFTNTTSNPKPLSLSCSHNMIAPGNRTITMSVTSAGSAVGGATVSLSDGIQGYEPITFYETAITDQNGNVSFNVSVVQEANRLYTGARLHNYNPTTSTIEILPGHVHGMQDDSPLRILIYPNPVVETATIEYFTPVACKTTVRVMDLSGRTVEVLINEGVVAGLHSITWTPENMPSGIYFINLTTPSGSVSTQVIIFHCLA